MVSDVTPQLSESITWKRILTKLGTSVVIRCPTSLNRNSTTLTVIVSEALPPRLSLTVNVMRWVSPSPLVGVQRKVDPDSIEPDGWPLTR